MYVIVEPEIKRHSIGENYNSRRCTATVISHDDFGEGLLSLLFTISCRDALLKVGKCVETSIQLFLNLQSFSALAEALLKVFRGYASRAFCKL